MKKLQTYAGGHPLTLDDLSWLGDGVIEAMGLAATRLGVNTYWLVQPTFTIGTPTTYTAGVVMINGVVYVIDANATGIPNIGTNTYIYLEPDISYDATGDKQYADGNVKHTYVVTKMKLMSYAAAQTTTNVLYSAVPHFNDLIGGIIEQRNNKYSKIQSLGTGATVSIAGGAAAIGDDGNSFDVNIGTNDTLSVINRQIAKGTVVTLRFVGVNTTDLVTVQSGGGMQTAASLNYVFRSGQSATFVSLSSTSIIWQLLTPAASEWTTLTNGNLLNGWTVPSGAGAAELRYRVTADGRVEFHGVMLPGTGDLVYTMPASLRPKRDTFGATIVMTGSSTSTQATISIYAANGNLRVADTGGTFTGLQYYLTGFSYYIQ